MAKGRKRGNKALTHQQRKDMGIVRVGARLDVPPTKVVEDPRAKAQRRFCRTKDRRQARQWE